MAKSPVGRKKRGQLSLDDQKFIKENFDTMSISDIADALNRNKGPIEKYIKENPSIIINDEDRQSLKQKLYCKTFWPEINRQFDEASGEFIQKRLCFEISLFHGLPGWDFKYCCPDSYEGCVKIRVKTALLVYIARFTITSVPDG